MKLAFLLLRERILDFLRATRASISVEAALIMPLLAWWYAGSFVFFDAFKTYNQSVKASYTISDILTRQLYEIGPSYIDGLGDLFEYLNESPGNSWIRVSSVSWDISADDYRLDWSYATGSHNALKSADIDTIRPKLPKIGVGETLVIVESFLPYKPLFNVNFAARTYYNFVPSRPRYASKVPYNPNL
ncbi:MAG: hypothetical protein D6688_06615 [Alphaproteobacteria bacterium]|nr:MAG: hypothetical protein D6688_06615 [Alphaproteobacteria bacterium]